MLFHFRDRGGQKLVNNQMKLKQGNKAGCCKPAAAALDKQLMVNYLSRAADPPGGREKLVS